VPTVLQKDGFDVRIDFNDHEPPHVHSFEADGKVKIALGDVEQTPELMQVQNMKPKDAKRALAIVAEHQEFLLESWREYHD